MRQTDRRNPFFRILLPLFFILFFSSLLWAEEVQNLPEITVSDSSENSSLERPSAFVTVIDPKPFAQQIKTLPELLAREPGVNVQQFGGLGQFSTVTLRGSTAEQVTVLLDGVRLNTAEGGAFDFSTLPLHAIDRIEIIRGGGASQFGSDSIGGVVQIFTKRSKKKPSYEASLTGGSFGTFKANAGYSKPFEKTSILLNYTHLHSAGDFKFKTTPTFLGGRKLGGDQVFTRENNAFWSESALLKWAGDPSSKVHLELVNDFFVSKREVPPTEQEAVFLAPANPPEARETLLRNLSSLKAEIHSLGKEGLNLELQGFYRLNQSRFQDPSPALIGKIDVKSLNQASGGKMAWSYTLESKKIEQSLKFSYDFRYDRFRGENFINPQLSSNLHERLTHGIFLSDEIALLDRRLMFYPLLRLENTSDFGTQAAFHLGLKAQPLSWLALKSNVENAFRYPNFNELYLPDQGIIRGNPNLLPEKSINFDAGLSFEHRLARTEISYFRNWIENSILFVPISAFTIAPVNTNRVHTQGVELTTQIHPKPYMLLDANYTLLLAKIAPSGNALPGRPRHKGNLKLTFKNRWGSVYAALQYIDRLPLDFANTTFVQKRAQLDLGGVLQFEKHYFFALELKNVTNAQILDARGFPLPRLSILGSVGARF